MRGVGRAQSARTTNARPRASTGGGRHDGASHRRPASHRRRAAIFLVVGIAIVLVNDAVVIGAAPGWLTPAGLHELYSFAGFMGAAAATWWFGWFDRR